MPVYEIEAPDGRVIEMEGDAPPSEDVIRQAFDAIGGKDEPGLARKVWDAAKSVGPQRIFEKENLPSTLGAVGGALLGPLGWAAMGAGAAMGGSAGGALNALREGRMPTRREIALEGGVQGAMSVLGSGISTGAGKLAIKAMGSGLKAPISELRKVVGGSLKERDIDIVTNALNARTNPLRTVGTQRLQGMTDAADDLSNAMIMEAPATPVPNSGARQVARLRELDAEYAPGSAVEKPRAAIASVRRQMLDAHGEDVPGMGRVMKDQTPQQIAATRSVNNRRLRGMYGKDADDEAEALKALTGEQREILEQAVPGTQPIGRRMSELINLRTIADMAQLRSHKNNPVSITDILSVTAGNPGIAAVSVAQKAPVISTIGRGLWRASGNLQRAETDDLLYALSQELGKDPAMQNPEVVKALQGRLREAFRALSPDAAEAPREVMEQRLLPLLFRVGGQQAAGNATALVK